MDERSLLSPPLPLSGARAMKDKRVLVLCVMDVGFSIFFLYFSVDDATTRLDVILAHNAVLVTIDDEGQNEKWQKRDDDCLHSL